jgi:putative membrane protein
MLLITISLCTLREFQLFDPPELTHYGHQLIGISLGLLLVYRTNSSYDRFLEGRKFWGSLVNTSRNIMRMVRTADPNVDCNELGNLVAAFCYSLKERLRGINTMEQFSVLLNNQRQIGYVDAAKNKPLAISQLITDWLHVNSEMCRERAEVWRTAESYMALLIDAQGGLERIAQTPIPFSYVVQINQILGAYLITLPFALFHAFGWYTVPAVVLISFSLLGVEQAGLMMEDPFGVGDSSDLNLDGICNAILTNMKFMSMEYEPLVDKVPLLSEKKRVGISVL